MTGQGAADRIAKLAVRFCRSVTVWGPPTSPCGQWEAESDRWIIIEGSAARLADQLEQALGTSAPKDPAGAGAPRPSLAGQDVERTSR